ncbi:MAG: MmcQ/YjbR family DNA-binding protein [Planctomycetes bacterium]|nr:MmcQ/YjbR family DNA-binding protein [Planctomycetota bacterium]
MAEISKIAKQLRKFALSYPEAWEDFPWEHQVIKVRKKIFAFIDNDGNKQLNITVKLPDSGGDAIAMEQCELTGYGLGKAGWITARFKKGDKLNEKQLRAWIHESYKSIAPKSLTKTLPESTK